MQKSGKSYGQAGGVVTAAFYVLLTAALVAAIAFGIWANNGRQNYKNDSDKKSAAAVTSALAIQKATLQKQFDEQSKQPVQTYTGPSTYGSVKYNYPKTWDGYVDTTNDGNPIVGFYYQGTPPLQNDVGILYSLRVELLNADYASTVTTYTSQVKQGRITATPYVPPSMVGQPNVQTGMRFDGLIESNASVQGSMVVLKVRDRTLKIYTESPSYLNDFNDTVLASLTYVP